MQDAYTVKIGGPSPSLSTKDVITDKALEGDLSCYRRRDNYSKPVRLRDRMGTDLWDASGSLTSLTLGI